MSSLVKIHERLVNFAVFLRKRDFVARDVIRQLKMTTRAFELLEMLGDVFGGDEFMPEYGAKQFSHERTLLVSY